MARRQKARRQERAEEPTRAFAPRAVPRYKHGDYLRVELLSGSAEAPMSLWICVDHCDERHALVFGTIESEPSRWLGDALKLGAKLAATYRQVQEHRPPS